MDTPPIGEEDEEVAGPNESVAVEVCFREDIDFTSKRKQYKQLTHADDVITIQIT